MKKYRWGIVSDLVRALSNPSNDGIDLDATGAEHALNDVANIMDTMMTNNCSFNNSVAHAHAMCGGTSQQLAVYRA